jgi:2-polyprenyl-3-methyl-5-hydroxy-6-metoxy-1,4-benzoquinol methylase
MASKENPSSGVARRQPGKMRVQEYIAGKVAGKVVLDVGCADHHAATEQTDAWLHKHIRASAAHVLGVDLVASEVQKLQNKGYTIIADDALTMSLDKRFDVAVAGEIIEHVDNPGALIRNLAGHLRPYGKLILTTPHAFSLQYVIESAFCDVRKRWNPEHVALYDEFTLTNLLVRNGMRVEEVRYFARSRKLRGILSLTRLPCPALLASTIVVIASPAP